MTSEQTCTTRDVVVAIRRAYRSGGPGYERRVEKIGVEELLRHLVVAGVLPVAGVLDPGTLPIETLGELPPGRRVMLGAVWRLSYDFKTLGDLAALSLAELVAMPGVSAVAADKIERALAGLSVLLRDGDPALLRRAPAPEIAESAPAPDPEQARATCWRALLLLGKRMLRDGASVIAIAAQVELDPANARKQLRMYSGNGRRTSAAEVARIAAPILVTEKDETKRRRGRRSGPTESETVIPIAFKGAGMTIPK